MFTDIRVVRQSTDDDHLVSSYVFFSPKMPFLGNSIILWIMKRFVTYAYLLGSGDRDEFSFS